MVAGNGPATSSNDPAMARTRVTPSAASAPTTSSISASLRTARAARWGTGTRPASWTRRAQATVPSKPALGSQVMKTAVPGARTRSRGGSLSTSRGVTSMLKSDMSWRTRSSIGLRGRRPPAGSPADSVSTPIAAPSIRWPAPRAGVAIVVHVVGRPQLRCWRQTDLSCVCARHVRADVGPEAGGGRG